MELYNRTAALLAEALTKQYSTSFSMASTLFARDIRSDIYNIYGLVRIADEIVDTYDGPDQASLLNDLEQETYEAIKRGFSTNPIVQAFAATASKYGIDQHIIAPFFDSMRLDLQPQVYDAELLQTYIYGSAEVVGLMCLKVFCNGDDELYKDLAPGAKRLGAAYQKVNFLRDIADDYTVLRRYYFVGSSFDTLDESAKQAIINDITNDFDAAKPYVANLPVNARKAVTLSYSYYRELLKKLSDTPIEEIKQRRVRLSKSQKLALYAAVRLGVST